MDAKQIGAFGEDIACNYLRKNGYVILTNNWRCKWGEIDIIAKENSHIVFVEVKYRSSVMYGFPYEFVDYRKKQRLLKTMGLFLKDLASNTRARFDIISLHRKYGELIIDHFENVPLE